MESQNKLSICDSKVFISATSATNLQLLFQELHFRGKRNKRGQALSSIQSSIRLHYQRAAVTGGYHTDYGEGPIQH